MRFVITLGFLLYCSASFSQVPVFRAGDKAPVFSSVAHSGERFELEEKGTIILLFYRGYWCPHCNRQLSALNDSLAFLESKGAKVVAITPEKHASVDKTIEKTKASFTIISDTSNTILKLYGVDFKVDEKTIERYKSYDIDFTKINGNADNVLPVPAVFVIKDGIITYTWFEKDYRKRPAVRELLDQL